MDKYKYTYKFIKKEKNEQTIIKTSNKKFFNKLKIVCIDQFTVWETWRVNDMHV